MKILTKTLHNLLNDKLTFAQRGILITIILLKDPDPKIHLAKCKAKISFAKHKKDLIHLHKTGFIYWSGYKNALKSLEKKELDPKVVEVIDFFNSICGTGFKHTTKSMTINIVARLKEYSVDDLKLVIANRYLVWKDDSFMSKYLTPDTIFRPSKFVKYYQEAIRTKRGEGLLNVRKLDIKKGDLITYDLSKQFSKNDVYKIKVFNLVGGVRVGSGRVENMYGKDLTRSLKILENRQDVEVEYVYEGN